MLAFLDSGSEVNAMHLAFAEKLGLVVQSINIGTQKINSTIFKIYKIMIATFLLIDQVDRVRFFEAIFLKSNISLDVVYRMLFLTLSSANIDFLKKEL